jgi:hypothetical protein
MLGSMTLFDEIPYDGYDGIFSSRCLFAPGALNV